MSKKGRDRKALKGKGKEAQREQVPPREVDPGLRRTVNKGAVAPQTEIIRNGQDE
jgi:hypothetical protein